MSTRGHLQLVLVPVPEDDDPIAVALDAADRRLAARALLEGWRASRDALDAEMAESRARSVEVQGWIEHYIQTGELPAHVRRISDWQGEIERTNTRNEDDFPMVIVMELCADNRAPREFLDVATSIGHPLCKREREASEAAMRRVLGLPQEA